MKTFARIVAALVFLSFSSASSFAQTVCAEGVVSATEMYTVLEKTASEHSDEIVLYRYSGAEAKLFKSTVEKAVGEAPFEWDEVIVVVRLDGSVGRLAFFHNGCVANGVIQWPADFIRAIQEQMKGEKV